MSDIYWLVVWTLAAYASGYALGKTDGDDGWGRALKEFPLYFFPLWLVVSIVTLVIWVVMHLRWVAA